jgi:hypothetical protein
VTEATCARCKQTGKQTELELSQLTESTDGTNKKETNRSKAQGRGFQEGLSAARRRAQTCIRRYIHQKSPTGMRPAPTTLTVEQRRKRRAIELKIFELQRSFYPPAAVSVPPEHLKACCRCFLVCGESALCVVSFRQIVCAFSMLQPGHYDEIVEERGVGRLCGYPLCDKPSRDGNK